MILSKKYFLILFVFLLASVSLTNAQNEISLLHGKHFPLSASQFQPSELGETYDNYEILLPALGGVYGWFGNSAFTINEINELNNDISDDGEITQENLNKTLDGLSKQNIIGAGARVHLLGIGIKFDKKGNMGSQSSQEKFSLSFDVTSKSAFNFSFRKEPLEIANEGNDPKYTGKRIVMNDIFVHAFQHIEYALGGAMPFDADFISDNITIKPGIRLKYIQSYASLYMSDKFATVFTEEDGKYIDVGLDYKVNAAIGGAFDTLNNTGNLEPAGRGFGVDLGATVDYKDKMKFSLSFIDIGGIRLNNNVVNYNVTGNKRFRGAKLVDEEEGFDPEPKVQEEFSDFKTEETNENYTMPLPSRMIFQAEYHLMSNTNNEGRPYYSTALLTYVQGFNNIPGSSTRPYFSLGYSHDFGTIVNVGGNIGYGGYNQFTAGVFSSFRLGFFRIGLGSNNFLGLFFPKKLSAGADASLRMAFHF